LDPEVGREIDENMDPNTQIQDHTEASRDQMNQQTKTRDLSPWYCCRNATKTRHFGGPTRRSSSVASSRLL